MRADGDDSGGKRGLNGKLCLASGFGVVIGRWLELDGHEILGQIAVVIHFNNQIKCRSLDRIHADC